MRSTEVAVQEERNEGGRGKIVPFITFDRDSSTVNSGNKTRTEIQQDLLQFHVSFTRNRIGIENEDRETEKKAHTNTAVYPAETVTDSQSVQDLGSIGPYVLHVNQGAIKRYEEARSYRNWCTTTFQVTA